QWRALQSDAEKGRSGLTVQETAMQEQVAQQRKAESRMEAIHQEQTAAGEAFNKVQGELYAVGSEIARLEQSIQHSRELQARQQKQFDETSGSLKDMEQHMVLDRKQVEDLTSKLAEAEPALKTSQEVESATDAEMQSAEAEVQSWQERLEKHHINNNELNRKAEGIRSSIEMLDNRMQNADRRLQKLAEEAESSDTSKLNND